MSVKRIALGVSYDGSAYHGWQHQNPSIKTIQDDLEKGLSRVANHTVSVTCAGRTDAGVHASMQVVHFDTEAERSDYAWVFGANSNLPPEVSVLWAKEVPREFHARFSAKSRRYRYVLINQPTRPSLFNRYAGWYYKPLDEHLMDEAARHLIGEYDFAAYRAAGCQAKTSIREIFDINVKRHGPIILFEVWGNAFLLHMVRNIVGVLVEIGAGHKAAFWSKEVLESKDRSNGGVTATPNGLYLVDVLYPEQFLLPKTVGSSFFLP